MINLDADNAVDLIQKLNIKIDKLKVKIEKETKIKVQGAAIRSKIKYMQEGEMLTKYFFGLKKTKNKAKSMSVAYQEDGRVTKDPKRILEIQANFYEKLYMSNPDIKSESKNLKMEKVLSDQQKEKLEAELTIEEMSEAIKYMAQNKSPGTDGFQINIYVMFFAKIKRLLFNAIQFCVKAGKLTQSMRQGLITLIPKKAQEPKFVANWRPITLLNSDYKIYSKMLANRIKSALNEIIHTDQTGFLKIETLRQI